VLNRYFCGHVMTGEAWQPRICAAGESVGWLSCNCQRFIAVYRSAARR